MFSGSDIHAASGRDLPWLLTARAATRPDHPFLVFVDDAGGARPWTFAAFAANVERLAGGLAALGIHAGDSVVVHLENCAEFLLAWHALARLGVVAVTTNNRSSEEELRYFCGLVDARAVVTQPRFAGGVRNAVPSHVPIIVTATDAGSPPSTLRSDEALRFEDVAQGDPAQAPLRPTNPATPMSVQFTSGTTSRPKGVVWTHANGIWAALTNAASLALTPDDIGHTCLPLFHTNALSYSHLATLWAGGTLVVQRRFSASRYWSCVAEHGCTWGVQIPFMLKALRDQPVPRHGLTRWGLGAIDPPAYAGFGIPLLGWFGMTETVGLPIVSQRDLPGRIGSMGTVAPGYEVQVRRDDDSLVSPGETGMMWIRGVPGVSLFKEYLNDPAATAAAFDEAGWFRTGDRVTPYADGHIAFDGRAGDTMRVGAENVSEAEVERVLLATGLVGEAAVVGAPHPMLDQVPVAFVVARAGQPVPLDRLREACLHSLADFKVPTDIRVVDDLPRVTLGKIDKKRLRVLLRDEAAAA